MLLNVFVNIAVPMFLMIGAGVLLDRLFKLDSNTLSKLNFILAREYDEYPATVSQIVLWTTILSVVVVPVVLVILR